MAQELKQVLELFPTVTVLTVEQAIALSIKNPVHFSLYFEFGALRLCTERELNHNTLLAYPDAKLFIGWICGDFPDTKFVIVDATSKS